MKSVVSELLASERLRRGWAAQAPPPAPASAPPSTEVALVEALRAMALEQLPDAAGLHTMIRLLADQVAAREAAAQGGDPGDGAAIARLAGEIGDLVDALTVGGLRRGGGA